MGASTVSTSVRHIVVLALSQEAQKLAARAGQPAQAIQSYEVPQDLVPRALDLGASVEDNGAVTLLYRVRRGSAHEGVAWREEWSSSGPAALPRRPADAKDALDLIEAEREAVAVKLDVEARDGLAKLVKLAVGSEDYYKLYVERARKGRLAPEEVAALDARVAAEEAHGVALAAQREAERERKDAEAVEHVRAKLEAYLAGSEVKLWLASYSDDERRAQAHCTDLLARAKVAAKEREVAKKKADEAAIITRQDRLAVLVREVSTDPLVIGRLDAPEGGGVMLGLLPEDEAVELVRAVKLPVPSGVVDYSERKLTAEDARAECKAHDEHGYPDDEDGCEASYASSEPDDLTAEEWAEAVAIRAALKGTGLPEGELRLHTGTCACQAAPVDAARRVGVLVRLDLDGVTLKREYASK